MKKVTGIILSVLLVFTVCFQFSALDGYAQTEKEILLFHTNDTHARVEEGKYDGMGFAKIATYIKEQKEKNPNVLVLDAGDAFHGQTIATLVKGESIAKIMNQIGYDAMAAGNHDFDYGKDRTIELDGMTNFPILAANVKKADGTNLLKSYIIKEVDGIRFGIFGLSTPETAYMTHPKNVEGITFTDPVDEAKKMVQELKGQVDVIVALTHIGLDESSKVTSEKIAKEVEGIDVMIDGHSHTTLPEGKVVGNTLIASAGEYDKNLGKVTLKFADNKLVSKEAVLITKEEAANTTQDAEVIKVVADIKNGQKSVLSQVVGKTNVSLDGERDHVRVGETNLGNLIADAMLAETKAEVAITNGGGIRASINKGEITKEEIITVLPFGNYIVTKNLTGKQILEALEHGTDAYPEAKGAFPHVGGMTFKIDTNKPVGNRIVDVMVNGAPLELEKTYLVATNDFLAAGGDNYTMFKDAPVLIEFSALDEALIAYMEKLGEVAPTIEGRVIASVAEKAEEIKVDVPEVQKTKSYVYVVKSGDVLWKIAEKYKTTWEKLAQMNQLKNPNLIINGQELIVPAN
ncbi:5'-nucleotidase C-terminal domain-containing protein [Marinisporobacter balticus]|uniref:2',3'-cyclic-nucleotide 2'-phosphodiesterase (5'-nucleotidase family) n=1 Tax=Marinisporobacter balticus TaxID=2018667 RepID=A0A4R2KXI1_9FIRM|nr:5'-nucleotidase C-terminal domain-containing protein [Marinisporobacter balticus]TCO74948.1 2',3'-cyclic-nucleotide 2'-phosphodiesterase (5'-nucleotidase family) [Marinisporobacter balticus]